MKNFKNLFAFAALAVFALTTVSCSSDDDSGNQNEPYVCETCVDSPDALAEHDNSVKGVYKGIFVGSTGTVYIDIQNGSNNITATLVIDDETIVLTSTVAVVDGQPYMAPFTGTYNGEEVSVTLSVGLGGSNPTMVSSDIPGHPDAVFTVYKETSTSMIEAFEGTYSRSGGETGTFNILLSTALNAWGGIAKENGETDTTNVSGTINGNGQLVNDQGVVMGTLDGDEIDGSFQDGSGATVTITGYRTL